jgi:predicted AlkP superfamily phosphohydrolase/phosphomutase
VPAVLIIGLDGATWSVLEPRARAGRLPHLAALMARGAWGPLRSTVPALTLPAWSSLVTGKNPGGHGIFAFSRLRPDGYEPAGLANASHLRSATLWDIAGRAGRRVGVINLPPSYPIRPVNGFVVGCMLTPPGAPFTHPPELARELPDYQIDLKAPRGLRADMGTYLDRALGYLRGLVDMTRGRTAATLRLMAGQPTDVLCVVFYAPDRVQHNFWDELGEGRAEGAGDAEVRAAVEAVYVALDEAVGALVAAAGDHATVVLASDHGFVPKPARSVRVNRWLADHGLLAERRLWSFRRKVIRKAFPAAWRARYDTVDHVQLNRARTRAWAETLDYGTVGIWVHVAGRYPLGCVAPGAEYDGVRRQITDGLGALRGPDGALVFRAVQRREEVYRGPYVDEAPDVMALCAPGYGVVNQSLRRDLRAADLFGPFDEAGFTGTHDPAGMYLCAGPPVAAVGEHREYPIESIAPTVLHLLGLPVPTAMDGPVCTTVLTPAFLAAHPVRFVEEGPEAAAPMGGWQSGEDEARVAEHLRALGYLE